MTKFFSLPLAVSALVLLSACQGPLSRQTQDAPPRNEPTPQVTQEPTPTVVAEQEPVQTPPSQKPAPTQRSYKAGAIQQYSPAAYAEALADGKDVIIDFHASWCPICAANAPGIRAAFESTANPNVVGFIADYDIETALENQFGVSSQSTLVKVRGGEPKNAVKVGTIGPGPITQQQMEVFIQASQ
ncbi:hypothetical protein COU78_00450 [Candidatus Peregrinibacteria bacterium CG10_big_fil_rev_8_21_14_0_10_49_24]|nr:MAG: hypothetical protein COV83_06495 [Candidatus Peregrinibacteria bacterium CG11_big_fil_rev_8_21_14_0_20_49_14]PIR51657.1 MAG: hypothetical protein COU78_00450 [Candidatus Peregrinibacteria bacterium CG10_big_fil_rev_8_21_14_0_10_49_24]PJA67983.1 MAG: hypothetical protein CO157_01510 [Candidatus Peregrinibacteria bacterium CG_4_9_14_3_um_filter_49_12]